MRLSPSPDLSRWLFIFFLGALAGTFGDQYKYPSSVALSSEQLRLVLGGACPDVGCIDITCKPSNCLKWSDFCTIAANKCQKLVINNYARCGDPTANPAPGYTCSETSVGGCGTMMTGDMDANSQCPETQCVASGTCGATLYTCTAKTCGS